MAAETSCRLSGNEYDTPAEDSISMYYSFNGSDNDKTIENSELDSSVEITIEDSLKTVVKAPLTTPIKGKIAKSLVLSSVSTSSTPSDIKKWPNLKINEIEKVAEKDVAAPECDSDQPREHLKISEIIVESFQEMHIETTTNTDSSLEIIEQCTDTEVILKDATSKIWQIDNKMEILSKENDGFVKSPEKQNSNMQIPANGLDAQHSLAEKMVQEIRSLLQGTEKVKVITKGKENIDDTCKNSSSDIEKLTKSGGKKIPILKRPSRLSTVAVRRSLLQTDLPMKNITPATRILPKTRKSISVISSGIPTLSDGSSSSSRSSLKSSEGEADQTKSNASLMPSKRFSTFGISKSSLSSIPESSQNIITKKPPTKRLTIMGTNSRIEPGRNAHKVLSVAKTTLNSPLIARRDQIRKSINKVTSSTVSASNRVISVNKVDSTSKNAPTICPYKISEKVKSIPTKTHISREDFVCEVCSRSFRVSSIFEAHKKTHNPTAAKETSICKFCDKSFAISKALDKHLLENCLKIPLSERKKIKIAASQLSPTRANNSASARSKIRSQRKSTFAQNEILNSRKSVANTRLMPPPSSTKVVKAPMAHSGISKTPNKSVCCKPCEKTFDNVLSFAEHVLSHSNSSLGDE